MCLYSNGLFLKARFALWTQDGACCPPEAAASFTPVALPNERALTNVRKETLVYKHQRGDVTFPLK